MNRAYLAGILDGEGHIGFCKTRTSYFPRVLIVNTYLPLLEDIRDAFGGDVHPLSRREGWKPAFQWRFSNSRCADFLDSIYPWLRIKQPLADLVFAWDAIRPGRGRKWTEEGIEALELILAQCKWLTRRGPVTQPEPMKLALGT